MSQDDMWPEQPAKAPTQSQSSELREEIERIWMECHAMSSWDGQKRVLVESVEALLSKCILEARTEAVNELTKSWLDYVAEYEDTQPADLKWFARGHLKGKEFKSRLRSSTLDTEQK